MRDTSITGLRTDKTEFKLAIDDWLSLQEFSVQGQHLIEINLLNLMYGHNIRSINLSENHFSELDWISLKSCRNLVSLDISKNKLEELDLNLLVMYSNLKYLNLENNNLAKLDLSPLIYCTNLEELLIDDEVQIEWRNTILDFKKFSVGLRKYSSKIELAWKEYLKEIEIFRKREPTVEKRLSRAEWLQELEQQKGFEWTRINSFSRRIYYEVRNCYIYECFRGTISTVFSLMESFLTNSIPFEYFLQEETLLKKTDKSEIETKKLNLSSLAKIAKKEEYISPELYERIYMYLPVRHAIIHYPESTMPLGLYRTSIRGSGTKSRGAGFESPDRKLILPLYLQEAAEKGITLFLDLLNEFNSQTS